MPSMMKKAMLYLGLGSDEDFHSLDQSTYGHQSQAEQAHGGAGDEIYLDGATAAPVGVGAAAAGAAGSGASVRTISPPPSSSPFGAAEPRTAVRMLSPDEAPVATERGTPSLVRTLPPLDTTAPVVVSPVSFDEAQDVGEAFRSGKPVVMNLQALNTDLSRRLMDFTSGLCYALHGKMKKVGHRVYLLTPPDVQVSTEDEERLREAGLYA